MGYESCELPIDLFIGLNGSGDDRTEFCAYRIRMHDLWSSAGELDFQSAVALGDIVRTGRRANKLTVPEKAIVDKLVERGFAEYENDGSITPTFPVLDESQKGELGRLYSIFSRFCSDRVTGPVSELFDTILGRILSEVPSRLEGQAKFVAGDLLVDLRMVVLRHTLDAGRIRLPDDISRSTFAMRMLV